MIITTNSSKHLGLTASRNKHNMNKLLYEQIQSDFTSDHFSYEHPILRLSWRIKINLYSNLPKANGTLYFGAIETVMCSFFYFTWFTSIGTVGVFTNIVKRINFPYVRLVDSRSYHGTPLCHGLLTWGCTTLRNLLLLKWVSLNHQFWLQTE